MTKFQWDSTSWTLNYYTVLLLKIDFKLFLNINQIKIKQIKIEQFLLTYASSLPDPPQAPPPLLTPSPAVGRSGKMFG